MKIIFLDAKTMGDDIDFSELKELGEFVSHQITFPDQVFERCKDFDVIITNKVQFTKEILQQLPKLKLICIAATGMDNVDCEYAKKQNIQVKNVSSYSTSSVVQLTFNMVFHFLQDLHYYKKFTQNKGWMQEGVFTHFKTFHELSGKKFGIIGFGEIGQNVAKVAISFGAEVVYHSTSGHNLEHEYQHLSLNELLHSCDIISIHAPLNTKTKFLLNRKNMGLLKPGSVLLNLGRGPIINEHDLVDVFLEKKIFVGLDVLEKEPMAVDSPLVKILNDERILITPHIGWASFEARNRLLKSISENIVEFKRQLSS